MKLNNLFCIIILFFTLNTIKDSVYAATEIEVQRTAISSIEDAICGNFLVNNQKTLTTLELVCHPIGLFLVEKEKIYEFIKKNPKNYKLVIGYLNKWGKTLLYNDSPIPILHIPQTITQIKLANIALTMNDTCRNCLISIDLSNCENITDTEVIILIKNCKILLCLNLTGCNKIFDATIIALTQSCKNLQYLNLCNCEQITDSAIQTLAQSCKNLQCLNLTWCKKITDESFLNLIQNNQHLKKLSFAYCEKITEFCLQKTPPPPHLLLFLNLQYCCSINNKTIQTLTHIFPMIEWLNLSGCDKITNVAIEFLGNRCPNLTYLNIFNCKQITDISPLILCKNLKHLNINPSIARDHVINFNEQRILLDFIPIYFTATP